MKIYNKLVRDKITDIIEADGRIAKYRILDDNEYRKELNKKLQEEVKEYLDDNNIEELADIVEVIYGILNSMNVSINEFERIRINKQEERGAFEKKIYLEESE
jgi:predicted house-cleaning noncanonical NTP pyrophosphatase (MazG superfamily)